jgi:hypothetical protein
LATVLEIRQELVPHHHLVLAAVGYLVVKLFYPKRRSVSVLSNFDFTTQLAYHHFPKYSISIYDDSGNQYKRQNYCSKPIISIINADDAFSFGNLSNEQKNNYINGIDLSFKLFYIKILVHGNIVNDIEGSLSLYFVLVTTTTTGKSKIKYYPITCELKNQFYTIYSTTISISKSDFINYSDGEIYFSLVGDFFVNIGFPIDLAVSNESFTPISQVSSASTKIINSLNNDNQYFGVNSISISLAEYSNDFQFAFSSFNLPVTQTLFSTSGTIFVTGTSGSLIRLSFSEGILASELHYFGITLTNTDVNFNPLNDTYFSIILKNKNGNIYRKDACKIINNSDSSFWNIVFQLNDLSFLSEYVDYVLIEIKTIRASLSAPYSITFMSFLDKSNSQFNAFSIQTLSQKNNNYTIDIFNNKINIDELSEGDILLTSDSYASMYSLLNVNNELSYEIMTENKTVLLPENTMIKTTKGFSPVQVLSQNDIIESIDGSEKIFKINIYPQKNIELLDLLFPSDYIYNGMYIKNPLYIKEFTRKFLKKETELKPTNKICVVNDKSYKIKSMSNYYISDLNIEIFEKELNEIILRNIIPKKVIIIFEEVSDIVIKYNNEKSRINNKIVMITSNWGIKDFNFKIVNKNKIIKILFGDEV